MWQIYGLIVGAGVIVAWTMAEREESGLTRFFWPVLLVALVFARAYHVIDYFDYYLAHPGEIIMIWNGGLAIWGALVGAGVTLWIMRARIEEVGVLAGWIPLAQVMGRVANGLSGEFFEKVGILQWWGAEALLNLMLFVLLRGLSTKYRVGGYLMGYGVIRFGLEFWRSESWVWGLMGAAQWMSLVSVVIGWILWRAQSVQE